MRSNILAFAAGVLWLQMQPDLPESWPWLAVLALSLTLPAIALRRRRWLATVLLLPACALAGVVWTCWLACGRLAEELPPAWEGRDIAVVGVVAELPQGFAQGSRFRFDVEGVETVGAVVPAGLMLSWYQGLREDESFANREVRPGERWRFVVRLKRPHGNANPHAFDYEGWLFERGIRATGYVRPGEMAGRQTEMVWSPLYAVERARWHLRATLQAGLPESEFPYTGVLVALAIGDQKAIHGWFFENINCAELVA